MSDPIYGAQFNVSVLSTDSVVIPQGTHRHFIAFSNTSSNSITIGFGTLTTGGVGIKIPINTRPIVFHRRDIGGLIDTDIHAISGSGTSNITVIVGYLNQGQVP